MFRSSILAVSILGHSSPSWLVFGTPLWFGLGKTIFMILLTLQLTLITRSKLTAIMDLPAMLQCARPWVAVWRGKDTADDSVPNVIHDSVWLVCILCHYPHR